MDLLLIILMLLPVAFQISSFLYLILHDKSKASTFEVTRNFMFLAALNQLIYILAVLALQPERGPSLVSYTLFFMHSSFTFMYHTFYKTRHNAETARSLREEQSQVKLAKSQAEEFDLPWMDELTAEQEQARILAEIEREYKKG